MMDPTVGRGSGAGVDLPGIVTFGVDPVGGGGVCESFAAVLLSGGTTTVSESAASESVAALPVPTRPPNGSIMRAATPPPTTSVATAAADQSRFRETGTAVGLLEIRGPEEVGVFGTVNVFADDGSRRTWRTCWMVSASTSPVAGRSSGDLARHCSTMASNSDDNAGLIDVGVGGGSSTCC